MNQRLQNAAGRISSLELGIVALFITPILVFDSWMPGWAVALALVLIPTLWLVRWFGRRQLTRPTPLELPILLLLIMVLVGIWAAPIRTVARPEVYRIVLGVALFYAMVNTLTTARVLHVVTALVLLATVALGFLALLGTNWGSDKLPLLVLDMVYARLPLVVRPFWNPEGFGTNTMGGILAIMLPILIAFAVGAQRWLLKLALGAAALAGCLAVLLSQSRGAIVGLVLAVVVMGVARSRWFLILVFLVVVGGLLLIGTLGINPISDLVFSSAVDDAANSLEGRLELWSRALYMSQDFPFTGVGLGMFPRVLQILYPTFLLRPDSDIPHPHNILLSQVVDTGVPGLISLGALLLLLFHMAMRSTYLSKRGQWWPLAIGLLGSFVAFVGHGQFDSITSFIRPHTLLWGLIGLQTALWLFLRSQIQASNPGL